MKNFLILIFTFSILFSASVDIDKATRVAENFSNSRINEFNVESIDVFEEMRKFIQAMPVLQHNIDYKCPHCDEDQVVNINGYEHFFA